MSVANFVPGWPRWVTLWWLLCLGLSACPIAIAADAPATTAAWWSAGVEASLQNAGTNRAQLLQALEKTPAAQRIGMAFLIENMPVPDLESLPADFLLENVSLAYEAQAQAPWAGRVPEEFFLNGVLPYASVNEARDNWRKDRKSTRLNSSHRT